MHELLELIEWTVQMSEGTVVVLPERLHDPFLAAVRTSAAPRSVLELRVDDLPVRDAQAKIEEHATQGSVVVLISRRAMPHRLAHLAYVLHKGDGLVKIDGRSQRAGVAPGFCLLCCLTVEAWRSIDPQMRERLTQVTLSGGHYCESSFSDREPLVVLERVRLQAQRDPVGVLFAATSLAEREHIFVELFPPRRNEGFSDFDRAIAPLVDELTTGGDRDLQRDLIDIFARHRDLYFAGQALGRDWAVRDSTLALLAKHVATTLHLGGQGPPFWDLLQELIERGQPEARQLLGRLLLDESTMENALYVLAAVRPWAEIIRPVAAMHATSQDEAVRDLSRQVLRRAAGLNLHDGPIADDFDYYVAQALETLGAGGAERMADVRKLAAFQARIQGLEVGSYPKSIRTFIRAVEKLARTSSWIEAIRGNHLQSVSAQSREHALMTEALRVIASDP